MNYFALAEEFYDVVYVGVIGEAEDVIVGDARLLLCREVLVEVGKRVSLRGYRHCRERLTRGGCGVNTCAVSDILFVESARGYLLGCEVACKLIDYASHHFRMAEFFISDVG